MTGHGLNDTPAVHRADIGGALGASGSDVARAAGDLGITDDSLATMVTAVREGRGNLRQHPQGHRLPRRRQPVGDHGRRGAVDADAWFHARLLVAAVGAGLALHALVSAWPYAQAVFGLVAIDTADLVLVLAAAASALTGTALLRRASPPTDRPTEVDRDDRAR